MRASGDFTTGSAHKALLVYLDSQKELGYVKNTLRTTSQDLQTDLVPA